MFREMVARHFDAKIRILRTDIRREYMDSDSQSYLAKNGKNNQTTCVDTPAQQRVAERMNCFVIYSKLLVPCYFLWDHPSLIRGMLIAAYFMNIKPSNVLGYKPPFKLLMGSTFTHLMLPKVFGCVSKILILVQGRMVQIDWLLVNGGCI